MIRSMVLGAVILVAPGIAGAGEAGGGAGPGPVVSDQCSVLGQGGCAPDDARTGISPVGQPDGPLVALASTDPSAPPDTAAPLPAAQPELGALAPSHSLSVYARTGADLYLSRVQTAGGVGGGLGARLTFSDRFVAQADLSHLSQLGSAYALRVGGGVQLRGTWAPMAALTLTTFLGDRMRFLTSQHPTPVEAPAMALGITVAPLRFVKGSSEISVLELGVGAGWDWPGAGFAIHASLLEVGWRF